VKPFLIAASLFILLVLGYFSLAQPGDKKMRAEAGQAYQEGERTNSPDQRREAFNRALKLYTGLEDTYQPSMGSGKLYYDIANTYFELGEYAFAVLYYYRALNLRPYDSRVEHNLETALKKLKLLKPERFSSWTSAFLLHDALPLPMRLQLFAFFAILFFGLWSLYLWFPQYYLKPLIGLASIFLLFFAASALYSYYFAPIEGVIVQASALYRDAGIQYARVSEKPLSAGEKVQVLEVMDEGKWLKVISQEGVFGYIPENAVRLL